MREKKNDLVILKVPLSFRRYLKNRATDLDIPMTEYCRHVARNNLKITEEFDKVRVEKKKRGFEFGF
jgi:hypothetical protein